MARGRPSSFKLEYIDLARKFCLLGATNADLARAFDVAVSTIDKWIAENPDFSGAVKEGPKSPTRTLRTAFTAAQLVTIILP